MATLRNKNNHVEEADECFVYTYLKCVFLICVSTRNKLCPEVGEFSPLTDKPI